MLFFLDLCASVAPVPIRVLFIRNHGLLRMLFFLDPCRSVAPVLIRVLLQHFSDTLTIVPIRRVARGPRRRWGV